MDALNLVMAAVEVVTETEVPGAQTASLSEIGHCAEETGGTAKVAGGIEWGSGGECSECKGGSKRDRAEWEHFVCFKKTNVKSRDSVLW